MKKPAAPSRLIRYLVALLLSLPAVAPGQFYFSTNQGTIMIRGFNGNDADVTIPDWTNGYPVTAIGDRAFRNRNNLKQIRIGTNVTSLAGPVADYCYQLAAFTVAAKNPAFSSVDGVLFNKNQTTLLEYPDGKSGNYVIPNGVTSIGIQAFQDCWMTNLTIPNTVTNIGNLAFDYCTSLTNLTLPNSIISIGTQAFQRCSLTNISIPDSVKSIGDLAFETCANLIRVNLGTNAISFGIWVFLDCKQLTEISVDPRSAFYSSVDGVLFNKNQTRLVICPQGKTGSYNIPNGVTSIADLAFGYCTGLTNLTIPDGVSDIGNGAFEHCTGLSSLTVPHGVTRIWNWVFQDCYGLTNVTLPQGILSIGRSAFGNCRSLSRVMIPDSVTSLWDGAFMGAGLTEVTIPSSVTDIGSSVFCSCGGLRTVNIPNSVTNIGDSIFMWCGNLTSVTLPEGITRIGQMAFRECTSLYRVTIPNSVTTIGDQAFYLCNSLTNVTISKNITSIGQLAFGSDPNLTSLFFLGNAPEADPTALDGDTNAIVYYLPGTTGWGATFADRPTALWNPLIQAANGSGGTGTNPFGFYITGSADIPFVVEAATNPMSGPWTALGSCSLTNGCVYFSDCESPNHPARFYRLRSP